MPAADAATPRPGDSVRLCGALVPELDPSGRVRAAFAVTSATLATHAASSPGVLKKIAALNKNTKGAPDHAISALINAFAPAIYGMEMAKLACLCSIVGGCPGQASDA